MAHLTDLVGFLPVIDLVDTNGIDPQNAILFPGPKTLQSHKQIIPDSSRTPVDDDVLGRGGIAPGVRQGLVRDASLVQEGVNELTLNRSRRGALEKTDEPDRILCEIKRLVMVCLHDEWLPRLLPARLVSFVQSEGA